MEVPIKRLREVFEITSDGRLIRKVGSGRKGMEAGSISDRGYVCVSLDGKRLRAHRIVFAMTHGRWPIDQLDHINGIRSDNRPENLREVTGAQNMWNAKTPRTNTSGYKGVVWHKRIKKWHVVINAIKRYHLGYFEHPGLAALIYVSAAARLHGEYRSSK